MRDIDAEIVAKAIELSDTYKGPAFEDGCIVSREKYFQLLELCNLRKWTKMKSAPT